MRLLRVVIEVGEEVEVGVVDVVDQGVGGGVGVVDVGFKVVDGAGQENTMDATGANPFVRGLRVWPVTVLRLLLWWLLWTKEVATGEENEKHGCSMH